MIKVTNNIAEILRFAAIKAIKKATPAQPNSGKILTSGPSVCVKLNLLQPKPVNGTVRSNNSTTTALLANKSESRWCSEQVTV